MLKYLYNLKIIGNTENWFKTYFSWERGTTFDYHTFVHELREVDWKLAIKRSTNIQNLLPMHM